MSIRSASRSFQPRIRNGNWSGRPRLTWKNFCARWAGCSLLPTASTGYQSAGAITSWICCCTTAACALIAIELTVIELPDEQAAALKAKASAAGLTLEAWLQKLAAEQERPPSQPPRHIADVICENMQDVPPEIMAAMPTDGASQHDHYIYGWPKKEA